MFELLWTASTGWIAVGLLVGVAALPFVLRWARIVWPERNGAMRWHYVFGFGIAVLSFVHAWAPMSTGRLHGINMTGLWLATAAFLLLFVQLMLGLKLREARSQISLRRSHFFVVIAAAGLIVAHVALNQA
jgi:uncharacterized membrane protein